ncbi:hypothetical protein E4U53_005179 [Claviceps sorghi]|nr:hypothetical protein E4U53_005179 [Claviceps sorghi]
MVSDFEKGTGCARREERRRGMGLVGFQERQGGTLDSTLGGRDVESASVRRLVRAPSPAPVGLSPGTPPGTPLGSQQPITPTLPHRAANNVGFLDHRRIRHPPSTASIHTRPT